MENTNDTGFARVPTVFFQLPEYRAISAEAKLLYGLMLNRTSLSAINGWEDELGEVFIYYTIENAADDLCVSRNKVMSAMKELEALQLIRRKRQGMGRPSRIYVVDLCPPQKLKNETSQTSLDSNSPCVKSFSGTPRSSREVLREVPDLICNKKEKNKKEKNKKDTTTNPPSVTATANGILTPEARAQLQEDHSSQAVRSLADLLFETIATPSQCVRVDGTITSGYRLAERFASATPQQLDQALAWTEQVTGKEPSPNNFRETLLSAINRVTYSGKPEYKN